MSLNLLEAEYRGVVLPPAEPYQWGGLYGYDPIYIQIAQDLIAKINTGVYPLEQYLPHEAELAKAYGVSLTTVRKALVELRRLGYCRTLNVKGSIAQRCSIETVCRAVRNPTRKRDAMRYLYGLQFMALLAGPAARLAAPRFTAEEKAALAAQFKRPDAIPLILLVECIGRHLDPEPLRAIFLETEHLVRWGYCTLLHESRSERVRRVNHKSRAAFDALLAEDMETFSLEMADYYRSSFQMVRTQYIQYYQAQRGGGRHGSTLGAPLTCRFPAAEGANAPGLRWDRSPGAFQHPYCRLSSGLRRLFTFQAPVAVQTGKISCFLGRARNATPDRSHRGSPRCPAHQLIQRVHHLPQRPPAVQQVASAHRACSSPGRLSARCRSAAPHTADRWSPG
ncbi:MAG: GntR family transcriptional regulator [Intestinimonas sp.]